MSFSSAKSMVRRHASIANYEVMLLDLAEVPSIDYTTARALEDIIIDTNSANRAIFLIGAGKNVFKTLVNQDVLRHIDSGHIYENRLDALLHARQLLNH
jgi:SulP family sulfate permease